MWRSLVSALDWGSRGRWFESSHLDYNESLKAKWTSRQVFNLEQVGSSPTKDTIEKDNDNVAKW